VGLQLGLLERLWRRLVAAVTQLEVPIRRAPDLLEGVVRGRPYVHNPWRKQALALLSRRAWALLQAADGRPLGEVLRDLGGEPADWLRELPVLERNGFVVRPGAVSSPPVAASGRGEPARRERVVHLWLHLTNACNLACPYCYIHKDAAHMGDEVRARTLAAVAATAAAGEVDRIHVRFAGGEPMLRFAQLQEFVRDARAACAPHGVEFSAAVLTNGTVVPKGAPAWLREHGLQVSVSIDGVGDTQDVMRPVVGGGSSWQRLQDGLDAYLAAGLRPYVLVTVGESNIKELPALTAWLLERKLAFRYSLVRDLEWGRALLDDRHGADDLQGTEVRSVRVDEGPWLLSGEPLRRLQSTLARCYDLIEAAVAAGGQPSFRASHKFCDLEPWQPIRQACAAGDTYLAVGDGGVTSPCQAALHHPGTAPLRPTSLLAQARSQSQFGHFRRTEGNDECRRCRHRASCAGGCPLLLHRRDGHVNGRSPYCEVFRAVLPRIVRIAALELSLAEARARRQEAA
jgi:uncharacterized protein